MVKILGRIINKRIEGIAERHLPDRQFGFQQGRSTVDAINLVVKAAKDTASGERWESGDKKYCAAVTLDDGHAECLELCKVGKDHESS